MSADLRPPIPNHVVMRSILLNKGPITTQNTLRNNFTKLRHVTKEQFVENAKALELINLGKLVSVPATKGSRRSTVFIKRPPSQYVQDRLRYNAAAGDGLCTVEEYNERFNLRIPSIISLRLRAQLVHLGLVSEKLLK